MAELELKRLGRYELVRELGRGAMGVVYEGHDPVVDRRVAIKTARRDILEGSTRADELMERFLREARSAGSLSHPNIVTVYDAGEEQGTAYIAMEYLEGTDLQKLLDQNRRFPIEQVLEITSTLCGALAHAHDHGIVHRDVKPANIVMLPDGRIKVADFGIARVTDSQLTQEGAIIGTPHYMSPEQFMGHAVDARSDIFSAGVIAYELLTGEKPFHGKTLSAVMHNVLHVMPVPPRQLNFAVTDCLSRVVMKALSKEPAHRYQTAGELCRALQECLKDHPDPAITQVGVPSETLGLAETVPASGGAETVLTAGGGAATAAPGVAEDAGTYVEAPVAMETAQEKRGGLRRRVLAGGAGVLVVALGALGVWSLMGEPEGSKDARAGAVLLASDEARPSDDFYQEYRIRIQNGIEETPADGVRVTLYEGDEKTGRELGSRMVNREVRVVVYDPEETLLTLVSDKQGFDESKLPLIVRGPDEPEKRVVEVVANIFPPVPVGGLP